MPSYESENAELFLLFFNDETLSSTSTSTGVNRDRYRFLPDVEKMLSLFAITTGFSLAKGSLSCIRRNSDNFNFPKK